MIEFNVQKYGLDIIWAHQEYVIPGIQIMTPLATRQVSRQHVYPIPISIALL